MSENVIAKHGLEPLKRAIMACEKAGTGAKVMCHIGGVETPELMSQILDLLRPGRHPHALLFRRAQHRRRRSPTSCRTASCCRRRSPPSSAASCSTSATAAAASTTRSPKAAIAARAPARHDLLRHPRVLRQHAGHAVPDLGDEQVPGLGFTLEQVVAMATVNPAKVINRVPKLGTLQVGAPGDVAAAGAGRGAGVVRRHAQQQAPGQGASQAGADRVAGVPFGRPYQRAVRGAVRLEPRGRSRRPTPNHFDRTGRICFSGLRVSAVLLGRLGSFNGYFIADRRASNW